MALFSIFYDLNISAILNFGQEKQELKIQFKHGLMLEIFLSLSLCSLELIIRKNQEYLLI